MISWLLERREPLTDRTLGVLVVEGRRVCWTLEPSLTAPVHPGHPAIAEGVFPLVITPSGRAQRGELWSPRPDFTLPLILNVPGRDAIRIHALNVPRDTKGCVGVGERGASNDLMRSRVTLEAVMNLLSTHLARDIQGVQLTVTTIRPPVELA